MTLSAESLVAMGNGLMLRGEIGEAIEQYRQALALRPQSAEIHNNLGA